VVGPPDTAFATFDQIVQAIAAIGLELSAGKSEAYVPALASHLTRAAVSLRALARDIPVREGLIACGAAIGPDAFVTAFLERMRAVHTRKVDGLVKFALDANSSYSAQQALMLLRYCVVPSTMMFLARTHAPHLTQPVFRVFDDHVANAVFQILGVHPHYLQDLPRISFARKLIALDVVSGGLGLTSMETVAVAAYLGSVAQTMPAVQRFCRPTLTMLWRTVMPLCLLSSSAFSRISGLPLSSLCVVCSASSRPSVSPFAQRALMLLWLLPLPLRTARSSDLRLHLLRPPGHS
jgi:hypothetical protein